MSERTYVTHENMMSFVWTYVTYENVCFVCVEALRPCQQLWSCRAGQLPLFLGRLRPTKRLAST